MTSGLKMVLSASEARDITWVKVRGVSFASVYRPSDNPRRVDRILTAWTPPFSCVVAGDFNAGDSCWDVDNPDYHGGAALAKTMRDHGLDLISEPDVPTHDDGNVLDLAFSDITMAEAAINEALHSTSDHETLRIAVPATKVLDHRPENRRWTVPDDRLPELVDIVRDRAHELPPLGFSREELDFFAKALVGIIQGAVCLLARQVPISRLNFILVLRIGNLKGCVNVGTSFGQISNYSYQTKRQKC